MALDTKYRPLHFDEVLGQDATVSILREFIRSGSGLRQSYLFAGPFGSGKTTLGRILARSLLCDQPVNGEACGTCASCVEILETGKSADFIEIDAATNSGKDNIRKIVESLQYTSFSGKRRIYLFDEAHQLSRDALDALLKPMEDSDPGSEDKRLVCIFATTEPEKMRSTVVSRCAPPFIIRHASVQHIADRLEYVCDQEGFEYEKSALSLIAEHCECHIRDALKTVEGVSMLGSVTDENVFTYLQLNTSLTVLKLIGSMAIRDTKTSMDHANALLLQSSPSVLYEQISDYAIKLYSASLGVGGYPTWWPDEVVTELKMLGNSLVHIGKIFSTKPSRVPPSAFLCEVAAACNPVQSFVPSTNDKEIPTSIPTKVSTTGKVCSPMVFQSVPSVEGGTFLDPRAVNLERIGEKSNGAQPKRKSAKAKSLPFTEFGSMLSQLLRELKGSDVGQTGSKDLGDS
tara:strand:- start:2050 stop:3426 length:1377 start_codon:yes stop_codon:yes gene_type:complete